MICFADRRPPGPDACRALECGGWTPLWIPPQAASAGRGPLNPPDPWDRFARSRGPAAPAAAACSPGREARVAGREGQGRAASAAAEKGQSHCHGEKVDVPVCRHGEKVDVPVCRSARPLIRAENGIPNRLPLPYRSCGARPRQLLADPDLSVRATPRRRSRGGILPQAACIERGLQKQPGKISPG